MESELFHDSFANHSYEWVFSGIGVIVVGALMKFIYKHAGADKLNTTEAKSW